MKLCPQCNTKSVNSAVACGCGYSFRDEPTAGIPDTDKLRQALQEIEALKRGEGLPQVVQEIQALKKKETLQRNSASTPGLLRPENAPLTQPNPPRASLRSALIQKDRADFGGFWIRFAAHCVDVVAMLLPTLLLRFLSHSVTPVATQLGQVVLVLGDTLMSIGVWWTYTSAMLSSPWQATLGKRVCGLKVADYDGNRISFGRASGRYFASFLSGALLGIGFLMITWTRHRQALHDFLAGTVVVTSRWEDAEGPRRSCTSGPQEALGRSEAGLPPPQISAEELEQANMEKTIASLKKGQAERSQKAP